MNHKKKLIDMTLHNMKVIKVQFVGRAKKIINKLINLHCQILGFIFNAFNDLHGTNKKI